MSYKGYDDIDLRNAYRGGYWVGAMAGVACTTLLFILVGLYYIC